MDSGVKNNNNIDGQYRPIPFEKGGRPRPTWHSHAFVSASVMECEVNAGACKHVHRLGQSWQIVPAFHTGADSRERKSTQLVGLSRLEGETCGAISNSSRRETGSVWLDWLLRVKTATPVATRPEIWFPMFQEKKKQTDRKRERKRRKIWNQTSAQPLRHGNAGKVGRGGGAIFSLGISRS